MRTTIRLPRALPFLATTAILIGCHPTGAYADDGPWLVSRVSGRAWTSSDQQAATTLAEGMDVDTGTTVFTAERSRVMLVHGQDTLMIGPKSVVAVSPTPTEGLATTVLQRVGSVTYDVEKQEEPHFSVETPMLAAVVKGTHFTVTVGRRTGALAVERGVVGVTALGTGQTADVTAGQRANVGGRGLSVSGAGQRSGISISAPQYAVVAPVQAIARYSAFTAAEMSAVASTSTDDSSRAAPASAVSSPAQGSASSNSATAQNSGAQQSSASPAAMIGHAAQSSGSGGLQGGSGLSTGQSSTIAPAPANGAQSLSVKAQGSGDGTAKGPANDGKPSKPGPGAPGSVGQGNAPAAPAAGQAPGVGGPGPGKPGAPAAPASIGKGPGPAAGPVGGKAPGVGGPGPGGGAPAGSSSNGLGSGPGKAAPGAPAGKSDNGKGNGGTPGNGRGHNK